jgi:hypothetical protein
MSYVRWVLTVTLLGLLAIGTTSTAWGEDTSPSPDPSPIPITSPTSTPAPPRLVGPLLEAWALRWQTQARHIRVPFVRARWCFGLGLPLRAVPRRPGTRLYEDWVTFGQKCKRRATAYRRGFHLLRYQMTHPNPLISYVQWRP